MDFTQWRIWGLLMILLWTVAQVGAGAEISVSLNVDRQAYNQDEEVEVQVVVKGTQQGARPTLAGVEAFDVQYRGTSSQVQIINGSFDASVIHTFALVPKKAGQYTIGPATLDVDGTKYQSKTAIITIGGTAAQPNGKEEPQDNNYYSIETLVDNKTPYVNEQVIYTFRFNTRVQTSQPEVVWPKFDGLIKEPLGKEHSYQRSIGGVEWNVVEIKYALFASSAGKVTIDGTQMTLGVVVRQRRRGGVFDDDFFGGFGGMSTTKAVHLKTNPIELDVRPLPEQGKLADFKGLVGQYTLETSLAKNQVKAGDSVTLTSVLKGIGNIRSAAITHEDWPFVKVYEDSPTLNVGQVKDRFGGSKEFKTAIVAIREGPLQLSPVKVTYFDPTLHSYRTISGAPLAINVLKGDDEKISHVTGTPATDSKKDIKVLGTDLMPAAEIRALTNDSLGDSERLYLVLLMLSGPCGYGMAFALKRRGDRIHADEGYKRRERARKVFKDRIYKTRSAAKPYQDGSFALRCYLGDKFDFDGGSLTPIDTQRRLSPHGITRETVEKINTFLKHCDMGSYGGGSSDFAGDTMIKEAMELASLVDKESKR